LIRKHDHAESLSRAVPEFPRFEGEVVEIPLLLPGWQADALESAARQQGLTAAQMVRRLIRDFCEQDPD
jgi:hypothetical protein